MRKYNLKIPLSVPDLRGNEAEYLARCVADNWVSSAGPFVDQMEERLAALSGRAHGVATVNGTTALQLALMAAGVGAGDSVIVPDWTFSATANAVMHAGAMPVFADVTEESWTVDPLCVARILEAPPGGRRIAAILAVHALGHPADMDRLSAICAENQVPLIGDAAGALGARYRGRLVGELGESAIFSFNGNKIVTAGGGGMIVTDNQAWAEHMWHLSTQARIGSAYEYDAVGFNFRMTNLNAALGIAQLERLEEMVAAKRGIAARYDAALADRNHLKPMPRCDWAESSCWLYSVLAASNAAAASLVAHLNSQGIGARVFWQALSDQAPYAHAPRQLTGVAARLSGAVVSLPCSSQLTEAEQDQVIAALLEWRDTEAAA